MVVSDQGSHDRLASGVVVPDGGGQGQEALQDADGHPAWGVAAVAFEIELALEGIVDRLDDLAQRLEEPGAGRLGLALAAGRSRRSPAAARTASAVNMASRASRPSALAPVRAKATAGRAGCRPGAAATPRSTANAKRSTRTRPTRPGQSALRCRGSGRTPPGWNPPPRTSSVDSVVPAARTRMQCRISAAAPRSRLLYPGCCGRYGNRCRKCACALPQPPGHVSRHNLILDTPHPFTASTLGNRSSRRVRPDLHRTTTASAPRHHRGRLASEHKE